MVLVVNKQLSRLKITSMTDFVKKIRQTLATTC